MEWFKPSCSMFLECLLGCCFVVSVCHIALGLKGPLRQLWLQPQPPHTDSHGSCQQSHACFAGCPSHGGHSSKPLPNQVLCL
ncbi:hypothetical protein DPMN_096326 [Dreissena polymorpha]|uniref:Uncharacterized protein n=1 Tax=Dreissena polymorpha TaxID=45954 RepID=A0A9D4L833_DREPO|nr:hypothetical protein DPMN_096322 [Dreissena polymorpha]KAH3853792.1 hypothetical protein DPMN_096326 [Dreissena polymorpha]